MRPMFIIAGSIAVLALGGVLAWTRLAPAQAPLTPQPVVPGEVMTITAPEGVQVRSGPSMNFYPTSKLRYGETVKVMAKNDKANAGWLAIEPPQGSRSWINAVFVKQTGPNAGVVSLHPDETAPIKPASSETSQEPNVESAKLARGTHIVILGPPLFSGNAAWLPIQSPPGDVRYIPESAVARPTAVQQVGAQANSGFVAPPGGDGSPLSEADAALLKAKQHLQQAAQSADPKLRAEANAKLQALQQMPASQASFQQPGYPPTAVVSAPKVALNPPAQTTGSSTAVYASPSPSANGPAAWSKWGTLQKSPIQKDGQPMYRLVDQSGTPIGYAVAASGLTLEPHVNRFVCLYGTTAYRSDDNALRSSYTIVSTLAYPPQ
jgi:hypothetical protein